MLRQTELALTTLGHQKQTVGRLRSKEIIENKMSYFGTQMMVDRLAMERYFGDLTNRAMGRTCLPSWVRTHPRVQAKMIIIKAKNAHKFIDLHCLIQNPITRRATIFACGSLHRQAGDGLRNSAS
ncbi:MAG: hypothetical protein ACI87E_002858 [Mariniblastus sp.]